MWTVCIHGGAGNIPRNYDDGPVMEVLRLALRRAVAVVKDEQSGVLRRTSASAPAALAAAVEAVVVMEDHPRFNAGRGSCLNNAGDIELEAAVMVGHSLSSGAVTGLRCVRNPVLFAEYVRTQTPHRFLGFDAAEKIAEEAGYEMVATDWLLTERRRRQRLIAKSSQSIARDHDIHVEGPKGDTVGAVVLDPTGCLAGAVSTGGMTNKFAGRIGDSPCVGAGLYASPFAAVCGSGDGEHFIAGSICSQVCHAMQYGDLRLRDAVTRVMAALADGCGGLIAVDRDGNVVTDLNCSGMHRAYATSRGEESYKTFE